ncbi:MAG TPA: DUF1361 domain-containing protein [Gaiellaceae bacterium]|nr:DUF1361 domain-containing protein [Gaiellaceae bacterium]
MPRRTIVPAAALAAASLFCVALLAARGYAWADYRGLLWNLVLAWIPFVLGVALLWAYRRGLPLLHLLALAAAWLLFLPNAPYVLTDFVHLGPDHRLFDTILIGSFALTSLSLGFASLLLVQLVTTRAAGAAAGWCVALASLFLSSVGIYLGRVQRLNSWDVVHRPRLVASLLSAGLADPLGHHYLIGFVLAVCGLLTLAYVGLWGFALFAASAARDQG